VTITSEQVKAARQLLGWPRVRLAGRANAGETAIRRYENGRGISKRLNLIAVRAALESAGVIFVEENAEGPGVRLQKGRELKNPTPSRPTTKIESRLSEDLSRQIDDWIAAQREPRPSRSEAIRRLLAKALGREAAARAIPSHDLNASNDE
jgi:transcriptional regulator with XRE-family HTH domain